ncbi:MAG: gliding motility protein GldM [Sphingobacteriales bacterium]|jgi:gliding motility-associated protein GldM|nr:MAG: gliding motility protein GldM [Sphingobacteriales bacterium]
MALPKEPRQKMINMMYLVLTALLALNVSSEILNAFKTVNNSIATSNKIISDKNDVTYASFEQKLNDEQTKAKAQVWKPKADEVKKISTDLYNYIESVKTELKKESDLRVNDKGEEEFKEDNLDAAIRLMDEKGKGKELYNKLAAFKTQLIGVLKPNEFADNPTFQKQLIKDIEDFQKSIPINVDVPKGQGGKEYSNDASGWTQNYFHMTPTIAALTILSKFQNDVRNSESQIVDYCHEQIGAVKLVYNKFQAIATSNTTYAMPGDDIEITAGVGAFSDAAKPKITIGGQTMPLTAEGTAIYKSTASGTGAKSVNVVIEFIKPDGTPERVTKEVKYTVGVASGASIFLKKMNVVYLGVDNPVTISGGSVGSEKVKVSFTNGSITKAGKDDYVIVPSSVGPGTVTVNADGTQYKFELRCKMLPNPVVSVGGVESGPIPSAQFKAMGGMLAKLKDSDFDAAFQVVGYKVGGYVNGIYQEAAVDGPRWTAANNLIGSAKPGSQVFFDNIRVKGPDGKVRSIPGTFFTLK